MPKKLSNMSANEFLTYLDKQCRKVDAMTTSLHPSLSVRAAVAAIDMKDAIRCEAVDKRCRCSPTNYQPQADKLEGLPPDLVIVWAGQQTDLEVYCVEDGKFNVIILNIRKRDEKREEIYNYDKYD